MGNVGNVGGDVKPGKLGIVEMEGSVGSAGRANGESSENAGIKSADSLFPRFPLFLVVRRMGVKPSEDGEKGKPGNPEIESRRKGEGKRETIDRSGETNMTKGEFGLEFDMEFDGNARLGEKMKFEFEFDRSIFGSMRSKNSTFFSLSKNSTFFSLSNTQLAAKSPLVHSWSSFAKMGTISIFGSFSGIPDFDGFLCFLAIRRRFGSFHSSSSTGRFIPPLYPLFLGVSFTAATRRDATTTFPREFRPDCETPFPKCGSCIHLKGVSSIKLEAAGIAGMLTEL